MTVIVGFVGPDGAVMASDTEATEGQHIRYDTTDKIWRCGGLLFGYSGTSSVRQPVIRGLEQLVGDHEPASQYDPWALREPLRDAYARVLRAEYSGHAPKLPEGHVPTELAGTLLTIGRGPNGYWMLELNHIAQPSFYEQNGFHAIGSGSHPAQIARALLISYEALGRSLPHLRLLAHRTVGICIESLGGVFQVGGHVEMWDSSDGGDFRRLAETDLDVVKDGVGRWVTLERESIDAALSGAGGGEPSNARGADDELGELAPPDDNQD